MISDLHIHSNFSDGSFSIGEIIDLAKSQGMECIAITDHDTVDGVGAGLFYGAAAGLTVLPGIEFSASTTVPVHILGYNFNYQSDKLSFILEDLLDKRHIRASKILAKLSKYKIFIDEDNLPKANVGRSHIAMELVRKGYCYNISDAFERYLGADKLAYVADGRITPLKAVDTICGLGGESVIAHPLALLRQNKLESMIEGLMEYGLGGLEVFYPGYNDKDINDLKCIAAKYRLFITGGSDFHGVMKSNNNMLGKTTCELPNELIR